LSVAALTAAILGIAGCYGQTDLASQVTQTGATLHGRGAANNGPADAFFEYWKDSSPQTKLKTATKTVPGGASGAFDQKVTGLDDQTAYSYRLCGKDQSASGAPICAQNRSFTTSQASVQAFGQTYNESSNVGAENIYVNVVAVPGAAPRGRAYFTYRNYNSTTPFPTGFFFNVGSQTEDNITCFNVEGNVAAVGFRQIPPYPDSIPLRNQQFAYIVDGGGAGSGKDEFGGTLWFNGSGPEPDDCSIPDGFTGPITRGEASVSGTTSVPTLR
jgi:hypothetical protein